MEHNKVKIVEGNTDLDWTGTPMTKEFLIQQINNLVFPAPSNGIKFSMMQMLFAYWVKTKHFYGNWSDTGVGKTYSFILASRVIDAHLTIVIGTNSTTNQLANEIKKLYNDSVAVVYNGKLPDFDMTKHNYLIFNYEKGQQDYSGKLFEEVLMKYDRIDYIVFDEVHLVKQSSKKCSNRRKVFEEFRNWAVGFYNSYVSVLTATPYINTIEEVVSILRLMTGQEFDSVSHKNTLSSTAMINNQLGGWGILATTEPKNVNGQKIECETHKLEICGSNETFEIFKKSLSKSPLEIYQSTNIEKLKKVIDEELIQKGKLTLIYTQFVDGIVEQTKTYLEKFGYKVCIYTGETKDTFQYQDSSGKVDWESVKNNYDVLLASEPIAVGVDGIQKVCNKMIVLTLPWTYAKLKQLIGRIYRSQSNFDRVDIYVPMVYFQTGNVGNVGYDDKVWEFIEKKRFFSDACLKGEYPKIVNEIKKEIGAARGSAAAA